MLKSGSSYVSQSELILTFGLGANTKADSIEIHWPSGQADKLSKISADQTITAQEGKGVTSVRAYEKKTTPSNRMQAKSNRTTIAR